MRRALYLFSASLFILISLNSDTRGCSCAGGRTPCESYGRASAVFIGSVISVRTIERTREMAKEDYWAPRTFKFSIEQSFLGVEGREVEVSTGMGGGDCGYGFRVGERYLVYAHRFGKDERLTTSICTRTKPLSKAEEDLAFLRSLSARAPGVTISGAIYRQRENVPAGDRKPMGPMANTLLVVEGGGDRKEIRTDDEGRYRLSGLSPGKFNISVALPEELTTYRKEEEITLVDRGCAIVNFFVLDNGRISGTVFDAEGQPAGQLNLVLIEADHVDPLKHYSKYARTDELGRYTFSMVPPGRYLIAINLVRFPEVNDPTNAYPRTFYPGVPSVSEAEVISLGAGEELRGKDLRLPNRRAPSVISGKVVWSDGQPVANAGISFRDVTYHDAGLNNALSADEQGYFTIKGFVGQKFVIEARSNSNLGPSGHAEPFRITLANPTELVKVVITRRK